MRKDITVEVSAADRARLEAVGADRNSPQKPRLAGEDHPGADGFGTAEIMRRSGKSKPPRRWKWNWRGFGRAEAHA